MDGPHIVQFRFTFRGVPTLRLTFGDRVRVFRNVEGVFIATLAPNGWVTLSGMEGAGSLSLSDCESLWDDLMIEAEINLGGGWKMIESWRELNAVPIRLPKAAE